MMDSQPMLRVGSAVIFEGDHSSRSAGRNSTYDVHLRSAATGVPVLTVSARNSPDRSGAVSVPMHTSSGCESTITSSSIHQHHHSPTSSQNQQQQQQQHYYSSTPSTTPAETVREVFDALAKPVVAAVLLGEPVGAIVVDSAGAPRNRVAIGIIEHVLGYIARSTESVERCHASLVELDSRGELVDVLDPSSPHVPRIDENFDAQSVHIANATLLDVIPRHNRAKVARSLVPGRHCVCTVILRRRDGSLGAITIAALHAAGDSARARSSSNSGGGSGSGSGNNNHYQQLSSSVSHFRAVLDAVTEGLCSDPMPPTLPFSRSKLTFLLKGVLCQSHPACWIVALSPWYEVADDKELFADAATVIRSARSVAALTDLSTRTSVSPSRLSPAATGRQQQPSSKTLTSTSSPAPLMMLKPLTAENMSSASATQALDNPVFRPQVAKPQHPQQQQPPQRTQDRRDRNNNSDEKGDNDDQCDALSPQSATMTPEQVARTPPQRRRESATSSQQQQQQNLASLNSSPIPKENSLVLPQPAAPPQELRPQPQPQQQGGNSVAVWRSGVVEPFKSSISSSAAVAANKTQHQHSPPSVHHSALMVDTLVAQLQSQLKQAQHEQQQLKMRNLALTTQLAEADARAARCENIVAALQAHGKFAPSSSTVSAAQSNPVAPVQVAAPHTIAAAAAAPPSSSAVALSANVSNMVQSGTNTPAVANLSPILQQQLFMLQQQHQLQQHQLQQNQLQQTNSIQRHTPQQVANSAHALSAATAPSNATSSVHLHHYHSNEDSSVHLQQQQQLQQYHQHQMQLANDDEEYHRSRRRASSQQRHLLSPAIELPASAAQQQIVVVPTMNQSSSSRSPPSYPPQQQQQQQQFQQQQQQHIADSPACAVTPNIWSRSSAGGTAVPGSRQSSAASSQQQMQQMQLLPAEEMVVVGYNFDLTQEEEEAVRRELERRGIANKQH